MDPCDEIHDPFNQHFLYDLSPELFTSTSEKNYETSKLTWSTLRQIVIKLPNVTKQDKDVGKFIIGDDNVKYAEKLGLPQCIKELGCFFIKQQIVGNVVRSNLTHVDKPNLSQLQLELLSIIHEYRDIYFTERSFSNAEEIRFVYCLHAINHVLKTRLKIMHHNSKISSNCNIPDEYRDQGLVRPKVVIVVPFKDSAFR